MCRFASFTHQLVWYSYFYFNSLIASLLSKCNFLQAWCKKILFMLIFEKLMLSIYSGGMHFEDLVTLYHISKRCQVKLDIPKFRYPGYTPDLYFCKHRYPHTHIYSKNGCPLVNMSIPSNARGVKPFATDRAPGEE